MAAVIESRLRYRFFSPMRILYGTGFIPNQAVLEIGCGTGFFTLPLAQLLGEQGKLIAMDILPISVQVVTKKVQMAGLKNVHVVQGDALNTKLETQSQDTTLISGVFPAPMLPMEGLLFEMHRILKPGGTLSVWPISWVHRTIIQSELFIFTNKRNGVLNYRRS